VKGDLRTSQKERSCIYAETKLTPHIRLEFDESYALCPACCQVRMNGIQVVVNNVLQSQFRKESWR
jgi:hypothetical protein